ncbi:MAG: antibiotic biosynthesis monooxygenase [Deltaproteobacteria bacterium]|nr:antibiotic biosynthesis monooxygenase [Deltaproteobacteria bacterium]
MAVRVMVRRRIPKDKLADVLDLTMELRVLASQEPGYISGETLISDKNSEEYLVISTWQMLDDWRSWEWSKERYEVQRKIDVLIGEANTTYEVYHYPEKKRVLVA